MMKKKFSLDILLLPLGYLLFALVLFIGFYPEELKDYPASADVRAAFDQHFEEYDQVSRVLWDHPDYFDDLYEKTETRGLIFNTKDALEAYSGGRYLTEEEWGRLKALCEIIQPYEIAMRSHDGVNAVEWLFTVQESDGEPYSLDLYYIPAPDASALEKEQAVSEQALSYFGRYGSLSPIAGKDFWYESIVLPNRGLDESIKIKDYSE